MMEQLKSSAENIGFRNSTTLLERLEIAPPSIGEVMHNSYAFLVYYEISANTDEEALIGSMRETQSILSSWIKEALLKLEKDGLLVDAYLVLVLRAEPSETLIKAVRQIELSTNICRKHILWPSENSETDTLRFVTALSLPPSPSGTEQLNADIDLCFEAKWALEKYDEFGSLDRVAEAIKAGEMYADK